MVESVEGFGDTYIRYELIAVVDRRYARDLVVRKLTTLLRIPNRDPLTVQMPSVFLTVDPTY